MGRLLGGGGGVGREGGRGGGVAQRVCWPPSQIIGGWPGLPPSSYTYVNEKQEMDQSALMKCLYLRQNLLLCQI